VALVDAADAGHDLAGGAVAALEGVQPDRQGQAGIDPAAVDKDGAGPAGTGVAALLRAGQPQVFAQQVQQRGPVVDRDGVPRAVDGQGDTTAGRCLGGVRGFGAEHGRPRYEAARHDRTADGGGVRDERAPGRTWIPREIPRGGETGDSGIRWTCPLSWSTGDRAGPWARQECGCRWLNASGSRFTRPSVRHVIHCGARGTIQRVSSSGTTPVATTAVGTSGSSRRTGRPGRYLRYAASGRFCRRTSPATSPAICCAP
jgi:hypothetical protein